jgi:hypothetical protein
VTRFKAIRADAPMTRAAEQLIRAQLRAALDQVERQVGAIEPTDLDRRRRVPSTTCGHCSHT